MIKITGNSNINGHPVRAYDNCGKTLDRFTVVFMDQPERNGLFLALGMRADGAFEHTTAMPGRHLGVRIPIDCLPPGAGITVKRCLEGA